jgi:hypothetical protein
MSRVAMSSRPSEHISELRSARSFLELKMALKVNHPAISPRFTHIIATIGMLYGILFTC